MMTIRTFFENMAANEIERLEFGMRAEVSNGMLGAVSVLREPTANYVAALGS